MRDKRNFRSWQGFFGPSLLVLALLTVASAYLVAQSLTVEVTGIVSDPSGAAIPGAQVSVTNEATAVKIDSKTNEAGLYRVTNLIPGSYRVEVSTSGFKTFRREGFPLQVSQIAHLDVTLEVGQVSEQVTVTGQAPLLKLEGGEAVNQTYGQREFLNLPNSTRLYTELLSYNTLTQSGAGGYQGSTSAFISFGGNDWTGTATYINGTSADDTGHTMYVPVFTAEFVQEFRLVANSYTSEFKGVTAIAVETKSGTNDFHGGGNFAIQDSALNAAPWGSTVKKTPYRDMEWGFAVGGPIRKNKTFFFFGHQNPKQTAPKVGYATVPTLLQRAGDFSQTFDASGNLIPIYDPNTTSCDPVTGVCTRTQFPGNVIPSNRIDPVGAKIIALYPLPVPNPLTTSTGGNNYIGNFTDVMTTPQYNIRVDQL